MNPTTSDPLSSDRPKVQEREGIASVKAVVVGVVFLAISCFATLWSVRVFRNEERKLAPQGLIGIATEVGEPQIGIVNQRLFEQQLEAEQKKREQLRRLNSYGWVDRDKQIIHIPIDRAMEKIASESKR